VASATPKEMIPLRLSLSPAYAASHSIASQFRLQFIWVVSVTGLFSSDSSVSSVFRHFVIIFGIIVIFGVSIISPSLEIQKLFRRPEKSVSPLSDVPERRFFDWDDERTKPW